MLSGKALVLIAVLFLTDLPAFAQDSTFKFQPEQKVYVVAANFDSRNLSLTSGNLEIERKAQEQFRKQKKFVVTRNPREADFVFLIVIDQSSRHVDEMALALVPEDYLKQGINLDRLHAVAIWQDASHYKGSTTAKDAALAGGTFGVGSLFYHPSVAKDLVKRFHKDVLK